ncbi:MAG TPA: GNAT family N-acetyltransferase [Candidatus Limnocylindrales bacterium]|nr:GNAT family N-acetyltransferase [Candidatus Limnocylindrales bacterium]
MTVRTAPRADIESLGIVPLTAESWPALAELFEEGGDPRWCWCTFWRVPGVDYASSNADRNRGRLRALADGSIAPGLVALEPDGRAVGWVSLGPRSDFERLERSRVRPRLDDIPVWSVVCFVVSRRARRRGLAGRLLDAAIDYAEAHGAPALEAYPVDTGLGRPTAATLYTGTLSTFLRAGFVVVRDVVSPQATVARTIVRLDLGGGRARRAPV